MAATGNVSGSSDLNTHLWGPEPSPEVFDRATGSNHQRRHDAYNRVATMCLTRRQVLDLPGMSEASLRRHIGARDVVAVDSDDTLFPAWQFDGDGSLVVGVDQLVAIFDNAVVLTEWMTSPNGEFAGRTPAQALATEPDAVIHLAATLTAASW